VNNDDGDVIGARFVLQPQPVRLRHDGRTRVLWVLKLAYLHKKGLCKKPISAIGSAYLSRLTNPDSNHKIYQVLFFLLLDLQEDSQT
jgi:hypothetical protein